VSRGVSAVGGGGVWGGGGDDDDETGRGCNGGPRAPKAWRFFEDSNKVGKEDIESKLARDNVGMSVAQTLQPMLIQVSARTSGSTCPRLAMTSGVSNLRGWGPPPPPRGSARLLFPGQEGARPEGKGSPRAPPIIVNHIYRRAE
jgi:hypothetical protein